MIIFNKHFCQAALFWLQSLGSCVCAFTPSISVEGYRHLLEITATKMAIVIKMKTLSLTVTKWCITGYS